MYYYSGDSPIHIAFRNDMYEVFDLLLEKGADIYDIGSTLDSLVMVSVKAGDVEKLNMILSKGFDIHRYELEESPLHMAVIYKFKDVVKYLLEWKLSPNSRDKEGRIPLHHAAKAGDIEMCRILLQYGSRLDTKDYCGFTPLHLAVKRNAVAIVKFLVERGCRVNPHDYFGRTPFYYAKCDGLTEIQGYLKGQEAIAEDDNVLSGMLESGEIPSDDSFDTVDAKRSEGQAISIGNASDLVHVEEVDLFSPDIKLDGSEVDFDEIKSRIEVNNSQFLELERQFNDRLRYDDHLEENIDVNAECKIMKDQRHEEFVFEM